VDLAGIERIAGLPQGVEIEEPLSQLVASRAAELVVYQGQAYADQYRQLIETARAFTASLGDSGEDFARAVATNAYKLMAYKDEYEVARLYAEPAFRARLSEEFVDSKSIGVWLAPPFLTRADPKTGRPAKRKFGPWIFKAFSVLAALKPLRGTWADPFGYTAERRVERRLRDDYFELVRSLCKTSGGNDLDLAIALASLPAQIRGFGPVKQAAIERAVLRRAELLALINARNAPGPSAIAA
jgi:indolepyruvate ferredoxin oxidoreductase